MNCTFGIPFIISIKDNVSCVVSGVIVAGTVLGGLTVALLLSFSKSCRVYWRGRIFIGIYKE